MISYETYKVIHLTSLMVMFTGLSISFYGGQFKHIKILTGIGTLFVLIGGMGLIARLGFPHGEPWPFWINLKLAIWFIIGIGGAVVARRFPRFGKPAYFVGLILFLIAAMSAVTKF